MPAAAWTPATQVTIAREAAHLAPPDLYRQIDNAPPRLRRGRQRPRSPTRTPADTPRTRTARVISIAPPSTPRTPPSSPFAAISRRGRRPPAGRRLPTSSPTPTSSLAASAAIRTRGSTSRTTSATSRRPSRGFPSSSYGLPTGSDGRGIASLLDAALRRGRELYPADRPRVPAHQLPARESGVFDDRSTAFGVGSVAFSHAVTGRLPGAAVYLARSRRHRRPHPSAGRGHAPGDPAPEGPLREGGSSPPTYRPDPRPYLQQDMGRGLKGDLACYRARRALISVY